MSGFKRNRKNGGLNCKQEWMEIGERSITLKSKRQMVRKFLETVAKQLKNGRKII